MVLVTGGTGFLGAYIINELVNNKIPVRAIRRNNNLPSFIPVSVVEQVNWIEGDVLDLVGLEASMEGIDTVIHSAAKVSFNAGERKEMFRINIEGTANVVNMAIEKNISHFVHVSSVAALGRKSNGTIVTEEKQWEDSKINTNYAISKYQAEMEVWRGIGEGLRAVIVNPSTILGYGNWNSSSCAIFKTAYTEFPWYTSGINGFVDVEDVAKAIVLLSQKKISGERFILNSDNWSFKQLLTTIADGFGKKHPSKHATPMLGSIAWRIEKLKKFFSGATPLLTKESARVAQSKTYFDNGKILRVLPGFSFTPLQQTISKACENYLKNLQAV
ncbi:MAG: NAD-dependent epimerase/dehydratase family protein [Chitinophagaceae bacterium]|nr:NAD-dependent epimerase/dehydratase family protein [Chitinophagaceae bacterium]